MKLLLDVIGNPAGSGGSQFHAQEILRAWLETFPDDEVLVIGPRWVDSVLTGHSRARRIRWPNAALPLRILGQQVATPIAVRMHCPDAILVSLPVLSRLLPRHRSFVFAHDWRHLLHPDEFSAPRRWYRATWLRSAQRARAVFAISRKTVEETTELIPRALVVLAENGADHVLRWKQPERPEWLPPGDRDVLVTLGHRNNKRPELVIRAVAEIQASARPLLVVLGAEGDQRAALVAVAESVGVLDDCLFPGYISDAEYESLVSLSAGVVMASTDEGFGLPAAEALTLGKAVVTTDDSGLGRIFGDVVVQASPTPAALAAVLGARRPESAAVYAPPTWSRAVSTVRATIVRLLDGGLTGAVSDRVES